jgi:hypothetical protein
LKKHKKEETYEDLVSISLHQSIPVSMSALWSKFWIRFVVIEKPSLYRDPCTAKNRSTFRTLL